MPTGAWTGVKWAYVSYAPLSLCSPLTVVLVFGIRSCGERCAAPNSLVGADLAAAGYSAFLGPAVLASAPQAVASVCSSGPCVRHRSLRSCSPLPREPNQFRYHPLGTRDCAGGTGSERYPFFRRPCSPSRRWERRGVWAALQAFQGLAAPTSALAVRRPDRRGTGPLARQRET